MEQLQHLLYGGGRGVRRGGSEIFLRAAFWGVRAVSVRAVFVRPVFVRAVYGSALGVGTSTGEETWADGVAGASGTAGTAGTVDLPGTSGILGT